MPTILHPMSPRKPSGEAAAATDDLPPGVKRADRNGRFAATIMIEGRVHYLGKWPTAALAGDAYRQLKLAQLSGSTTQRLEELARGVRDDARVYWRRPHTSQYRGVTWAAREKKWVAWVKDHRLKRTVYAGSWPTEEKAREMQLAAQRRLDAGGEVRLPDANVRQTKRSVVSVRPPRSAAAPPPDCGETGGWECLYATEGQEGQTATALRERLELTCVVPRGGNRPGDIWFPGIVLACGTAEQLAAALDDPDVLGVAVRRLSTTILRLAAFVQAWSHDDGELVLPHYMRIPPAIYPLVIGLMRAGPKVRLRRMEELIIPRRQVQEALWRRAAQPESLRPWRTE